MGWDKDCLEKHVHEAEVSFVQIPLPIYERELTAEERNMHTAYWNKLTQLVPDKYFSPERPILNFMEMGLGLPTLSGQVKSTGQTIGLIDLMKFSGPSPDFEAIKEVFAEAGGSIVFMLSPMTCGYDLFKETVDTIKSMYPNSLVVAGGAHVSKLPVETLQDITTLDIAATDQKFTIQDLLRAIFSNGDLSLVPGIVYQNNGDIVHSASLDVSRKMREKINGTTVLDLDILPSRLAESSWVRIYTALGCAYNCAYCADTLHKKRKPFVYNIDEVMADVDSLIEKFGVSLFYIGDETLTYYPKHAREFAKRMGQRNNVYWIAQTRADCVDEEILYTLVENNCILLSIGAESGSNEILKMMRKGITTDQVIDATKMAKKVGLNVLTYWMTGLPGETGDTIQQSIDLQRRLFEYGYCDLAEDVIFVPYPGTDIFHQPSKYGVVIEHKPWAQWREDMPSVTNTHDLSSQRIYDLWLKKIDNLAGLIKSR